MDSKINITRNNTLLRAVSFKDNIGLLKDIPIKNYSRLTINNTPVNYLQNDNLGFYLTHNSNNFEYLDMQYIEIDNIQTYNKYIFEIKFKLYQQIKNIHTIFIYRVIMPRFYILTKTILPINSFLENNIFYIIKNKLSSFDNIQVHNLTNNHINFSINNDYTRVYEIEFNDEIIISYNLYFIDKNYQIERLYPFLNIKIDNVIDDQYFTTNNKSQFLPLIAKSKRQNNVYYNCNDFIKIYHTNSLANLSNLNISILTPTNLQLISTNYFDTNINNCKCMIIGNKPGCSCTYIRNKSNPLFSCYILLQIGTIKQQLINSFTY